MTTNIYYSTYNPPEPSAPPIDDPPTYTDTINLQRTNNVPFESFKPIGEQIKIQSHITNQQYPYVANNNLPQYHPTSYGYGLSNIYNNPVYNRPQSSVLGPQTPYDVKSSNDQQKNHNEETNCCIII